MALDAAGEHEAAERAYTWLARHQNADGSWYAAYADGKSTTSPTAAGRPTSAPTSRSASGTTTSSTGDDVFLDRMWPAVYAAVEFVLRLQQPGGQIGWKREDDGTAVDRRAADREFVRPPRTALRARHRRAARGAAARLGVGGRRAAARHPAPPGAVPGQGPLLHGLVLPGAGRRVDAAPRPSPGSRRTGSASWCPASGCAACPQPVGDRRRDRPNSPSPCGRWASPTGRWRSSSPSSTCATRRRACTGRATSSRTRPSGREELTTWTAGSLLLAVAALGGDEPTCAVFGGERLPAGLDPDCCA